MKEVISLVQNYSNAVYTDNNIVLSLTPEPIEHTHKSIRTYVDDWALFQDDKLLYRNPNGWFLKGLYSSDRGIQLHTPHNNLSVPKLLPKSTHIIPFMNTDTGNLILYGSFTNGQGSWKEEGHTILVEIDSKYDFISLPDSGGAYPVYYDPTHRVGMVALKDKKEGYLVFLKFHKPSRKRTLNFEIEEHKDILPEQISLARAKSDAFVTVVDKNRKNVTSFVLRTKSQKVETTDKVVTELTAPCKKFVACTHQGVYFNGLLDEKGNFYLTGRKTLIKDYSESLSTLKSDVVLVPHQITSGVSDILNPPTYYNRIYTLKDKKVVAYGEYHNGVKNKISLDFEPAKLQGFLMHRYVIVQDKEGNLHNVSMKTEGETKIDKKVLAFVKGMTAFTFTPSKMVSAAQEMLTGVCS